MPHRVIKSIDGRRGGALTIIAGVFLALGASQMRARSQRSQVLAWLPDWFGNDDLGIALLALAGVALACSLISKWSKWALAVGFACAMLAAAGLAAIYGTAAIFGLIPDVSMAVVFAGFTCLIYSISGWDESRPRPPLTGEQRRILGGE